jgi:hypothetical protein
MEQRELASHAISHHLEPVCPRDDHKMKFDSDRVRWEQTADHAIFKVATYHCGTMGVQSAARRSTATLPL